jgi:hypothetical protein
MPALPAFLSSSRPADSYMAEAGSGRRPAAEVRSLVAATAFDDLFRSKGTAADSSGASLRS